MTHSAITIRPATPGDIPFLLTLQRQTLTSVQWSGAQYKDIFSGKGARRLLLAAQSNAGLVGFLVAQNIPPDWELESIVVASQTQRTGIGKQLLTALIEAAKQSNSETVFLEVRESNMAARGLYEKCGFHQTGRRKSYYSSPLEDAVLYRLNLC